MNKIQELIAKYHSPEAWKRPMVWSVREDGEITLEKGGTLLRHRILHIMSPGTGNITPHDWWPVKDYHARCFVETKSQAEEIREAINDYQP